nr:leucine-rich repeat protein [Tanacetum cinerariifolium]
MNFLWKEERVRLLIDSPIASSTPSYSSGPSRTLIYSPRASTTPSYSSGASTSVSYSPRSSRNAKYLNCKLLLGRIKVLEATVEMYMHPEEHTLNSTALLHEVYNDMGKLVTNPISTAQEVEFAAPLTRIIHAKAVDDRAALLAIKSKINGDPQGIMSSWNDSLHFCLWEGIACGSRHQRVIVLNLPSQGLVGSLSPSIGNLSFLKVIRLQNNSLSGEIPPQVGRLFRLHELRLSNNSFQGKIPTSLTNCSNLAVLHMGYNNLVGKIPDEFGSLSMLNTLIFHGNNLTGGIPRFIGNLTFLETLSFGDCGLGGRIPDVFRRLSKLTRIALAGNNLVGTVPHSFYNLSSLEQVFFDNNRLTGGLPLNIGLMQPRLGVLSLSDNQFIGSLPPSLLSSPELTVLDVARN